MAALKAGRLQASALPPALEDGLLMLVPTARDRWPTLLSHDVPALQADGWRIERADDFPFEVYEADDFEMSLAEVTEGGTDWFRIGLKVSVGGTPVDLVPLLVGLVQAGWLKLEASLRVPDGEVLLPWPDDAAPAVAASGSRAPGLRRERLLRLPVARIAPLVAWLRGVFNTSGFSAGEAKVSRFELGAIETLSAGLALRAPPALDRLLEQLRSLRVGEGLPSVAVSPNVQAQLRPYQLDGLAWMDFLRRAGFGGVLADDMGLGKTLQTLALLQAELDAGRLDRPSLVVVPTSLLENWQAEATRFTPQLRMLVLHGKQRAQQFKGIANAHVVVTSYPLAVRDMAKLSAQAWHYLVLDEAQRIKNSRSLATLALKALNARHRLCLSGTPLENHLGELWSLMDFVSPGLLGNEAQFREHYRNPIEKRQEALQAEHLARRVRPFILRRTKLQVAQDLPEKTETLLRVELDGTQRDLYETVRATMDSKLREAIAKQGLARSQIVVLDALLKLRQVCCDPRLLKLRSVAAEGDRAEPGADGDDSDVVVAERTLQRHATSTAPSAKLELLRDLLPTLVEDGRRILVFSQFTEMLALIEVELTRLDLAYVKLTGDTVNRGEVVRSFQEGDTPIFLISLKAGGVGLNLTAADTVILYDPWWNPAVEQQAIDRAYRIGQGKPVFVYKLVASGTVEEKMLELQARKAGLADSLLSGVAGTAALTAQDFDELFKPLGAT
jgi:SNF2 family DNA or RNA helicase